jgi:hypothetical protein
MKTNKSRKYPAANHQPCHIAHLRVAEAKERQEYADSLTVQQKIDRLDTKFGVGVGAVKERAKLATRLQSNNQVSNKKGEVK